MEATSAYPPAVFSIALVLMLVYTFGEFVYLAFIAKKAPFRSDFLQPLKSMAVWIVTLVSLSRVAPFLAVAGFAALGASLAPAMLPDVWYSWVFALLIYEFWYWVQHFLAHKVRLLWCLHSPHHAPGTINMLVGSNHHVLETQLYFPFFFGFMTALCGVPIEMILVINLVDAIWGSLLHISPQMMQRRYGPLEKFLQTPSYHRVHHATNVPYMDSNYNSITLFWDWVLGTLVPLRDEEPVSYGITRPVNVESYLDVHFGEFSGLWADIKSTRGILDKLGYLFMPPGWSPTGDHQTVSVQQREWRLAMQAETSMLES